MWAKAPCSMRLPVCGSTPVTWPGKTVALASGSWHGRVLVDLPGTYSLLSHSPEEQVARNFLCTAGPERVVVVCDATTLERNLVLVLQILEITSRVVVCVNLMDEAKRKGLSLDLSLLSRRLGIPVVGVTARKKGSLRRLEAVLSGNLPESVPVFVPYPPEIEGAVEKIQKTVPESTLPARFLALKALEGEPTLLEELHLPQQVLRAAQEARDTLAADGRGNCGRSGGSPRPPGGENRSGRRASGEDTLFPAGPEDRPDPAVPIPGLSGHAGAVSSCPVADIGRGEFHIRWLAGAFEPRGGPPFAASDRLGCSGVANGSAGAGGLADDGLGLRRYAAAHGHFLSAVYASGRCGVSAPGGVPAGPALLLLPGLREAGSDHVHGTGLQCRRSGRLPDHRLAPGAAAGHSHQQYGAL